MGREMDELEMFALLESNVKVVGISYGVLILEREDGAQIYVGACPGCGEHLVYAVADDSDNMDAA